MLRFMCVFAVLPALALAAPTTRSFQYGPTQAGQSILDRTGITSAKDIVSAVFDFREVSYKLTSKDNPELVRRFYGRLLCTRERPGSCPVGTYARVTIIRKDNEVVEMVFGRDPVEGHTDRIDLAEDYWVPGMEQVFDDIRKEAAAAALDSRLPDLDVEELQVRLSDRNPVKVPPSSDEGKTVADKARAIVDWIDPRTARAHQISATELTTAERKLTTVTLVTKAPVMFNGLAIDDAKLPIYRTYPIGRNLKAVRVESNTFIVMDYGSYTPVVVVVDRSGTCYLFRDPDTDLRRRNEERIGVEKGFPGHPVTDTEYYKSPKELYKELQELAKAAYEK